MGKSRLDDRRAKLARRLLELRPNRPPFEPPIRWRRHHGQHWAGRADAFCLDAMDAECAIVAAAVAVRRFNRHPHAEPRA